MVRKGSTVRVRQRAWADCQVYRGSGIEPSDAESLRQRLEGRSRCRRSPARRPGGRDGALGVAASAFKTVLPIQPVPPELRSKDLRLRDERNDAARNRRSPVVPYKVDLTEAPGRDAIRDQLDDPTAALVDTETTSCEQKTPRVPVAIVFMAEGSCAPDASAEALGRWPPVESRTEAIARHCCVGWRPSSGCRPASVVRGPVR